VNKQAAFAGRFPGGLGCESSPLMAVAAAFPN
jgi:hypothetical protein